MRTQPYTHAPTKEPAASGWTASPVAAPSSLAHMSGVAAVRETPGTRPLYGFSKRALDVTLGSSLLVLSLPVLALAGVAIVATTRESPLFMQTRIGRGGRPFRMLKLRTMTSDANASPDAVPGSKTPDDPRVTAVGRLLRRTSLDELPQLVNVIAGQMSLVGPRPALPSEVAEYPASWRRALELKPGLTGLWQVCGRSELTPRQRAALDRVYLCRRSFALDCAILLQTIGATLSMRGAW